MCRTLGWAGGCSFERPPRGMLLVLTNISQPSRTQNPPGTQVPSTQQLSIFTNTESEVTNFTRGLWRRARAPARAHTHGPAFVPVFRRMETCGQGCPRVFIWAEQLATAFFHPRRLQSRLSHPASCPEIRAGLSDTAATSRGSLCIPQGEDCFSKAPGCEQRSLGGGIPICPMTSGP